MAAEKRSRSIKTFVIDTNVLLHSAASMTSFQEHDVVIPMAVIEELDKFKKYQDELGRNARQVIRHLDALREKGNLRKGVSLKNVSPAATGDLYVLTTGAFDNGDWERDAKAVFRSDLGDDSPDNRILQVAYGLGRLRKNVIFISKDINLRLKADAMGIAVMDYERGKVDVENPYTGFSSFTVSPRAIAEIYRRKSIEKTARLKLLPNEFAVMTSSGDNKNSALGRLLEDGKVHLLDRALTDKVWNISPRNKEQRMALELLTDPGVKLVTLTGGAGTGKTLLALAAALQEVLRDNLYDRILVSRPIIPLGNDIGYLPGDKDAKLSSWMQPIFDNLDYLLHSSDRNGNGKKSSAGTSAETLINSKKLELEAITYIRGRSIPRQFVIVDEAQNLTPHEVKTIISRSGEGTKMVLTGDPEQIDNPYLDRSSNGLSYAAEKFKNYFIHGHVTLSRSERSALAALAASVM